MSTVSIIEYTVPLTAGVGGDDLKEAFEQCAIAMFGYMTELDKVDKLKTESVEADGEDLLSLLFHFLDEFLFLFNADPFFVAKEIKIIEFDKENFRIKAEGYGETFDLKKHPQVSWSVYVVTWMPVLMYSTIWSDP
jgi:SHS2 domain-containing protein